MVPNFEVTARISLQTNYFIFLIFLSFWSHSKLAKISVFRHFSPFCHIFCEIEIEKTDEKKLWRYCMRFYSELIGIFWSQSESLCRRFAIGKILSFLAIIYPAYQRAIFINRKNKTSFIRMKNPYNNFHWYPTQKMILVKKRFRDKNHFELKMTYRALTMARFWKCDITDTIDRLPVRQALPEQLIIKIILHWRLYSDNGSSVMMTCLSFFVLF